MAHPAAGPVRRGASVCRVKIRSLASIAALAALALTSCSSETTAPTAAQTPRDWAAHIQGIAAASGEKAFSQLDLVGPMVTLTYLADGSVMNGAGNEPGRFEYRVYDDYQDTRAFKPLSDFNLDAFAKALTAQEKACGDKQVTGRITLTHTGAALQRLGCEATTTKADIASTTLAGSAMKELPALVSAQALDTVLAEARAMHGDDLASLALAKATDSDTAHAVVTAAPRKNSSGSAVCAQTSTRWATPGTKGLLAEYADCAAETPGKGSIKASSVTGAQLMALIDKAAAKLKTAPAELDTVLVTPGKTPGSITVSATAGKQSATVSS